MEHMLCLITAIQLKKLVDGEKLNSHWIEPVDIN